MGKPFAAVVRLSPEFKAEFDFGQSNDGSEEAPDFSGLEPLALPKCKARYRAADVLCVREKPGPGKKLRLPLGRIILQRPIEPSRCRTPGYRQDRSVAPLHFQEGRPFSAFLVRGADGKVGFEFAPRAAKPGKARLSRRGQIRRGQGRGQAGREDRRQDRDQTATKTQSRPRPGRAPRSPPRRSRHASARPARPLSSARGGRNGAGAWRGIRRRGMSVAEDFTLQEVLSDARLTSRLPTRAALSRCCCKAGISSKPPAWKVQSRRCAKPWRASAIRTG